MKIGNVPTYGQAPMSNVATHLPGGSVSEQTHDTELIQATLKGDQQAFGRLVERYQQRSYRVAYNVVYNYEDTRDISQMAFVKAYYALDTFAQEKKFYTWFYRILVNLCVDHLRKKKQKYVSLDQLGDLSTGRSTADEIESNETMKRIHNILNTLPEKYRILIVLRDIEGLGCIDIAEMLDISHNNIRWRLHQARNLFKEEWAKANTQDY